MHFALVLNETITLKEVIDTLDSGAAFSMGVRTCNVSQKTGGEWIEIPMAVKHQQQFKHPAISEKETTGYKKNPNHYENSTRNIRVLPDGNIMKVHLRLIRRFNSKTVL